MFVVMIIDIASDATMYRAEFTVLEAAKDDAAHLVAPYSPVYEHTDNGGDDNELSFKFLNYELAIVEI